MHNILRGDNLRLLVNEKCVAASRSCELQINHQFEDIGTKDSTNLWAESEPVESSANGSVEALVTDGVYGGGTPKASVEISGTDSYRTASTFKLPVGHTITIYNPNGISELYNQSESPVVSPSTSGTPLEYTNNGSSDMEVYPATTDYNAELQVVITDDERATCSELLAAFFAGTAIDIDFAVTAGRNNIVVTDALLHGEAYITSLNLVAAHKQVATFNMAFQVNGELERVIENN